MVQKKFNTFQAVFGFVLMYTAIVVGILLREYPFTPIGVAVISVIVLIMLKLRNKIVPSSDSFTIRWIIMFWLIELSTYLTFYFIAEVSKVGYGVAGVLSVITFIFIFRIVWEGRDENESNKPTLESAGEDTQSSAE